MMYYEKYGNDYNPIIVCLHSANYVHCFAKQCDALAKNYCLIVPHLPGYGRSDVKTFSTEKALEQVLELISSLGRKVTLMGFALGAQLCLPLVYKHTELFNGAIMISPWLIKTPADVEKAMKQVSDSEKMSKNKLFIGINALAMGLDKDERQANAEFCQNVSMNTLLASVDNGIVLSDYPDFSSINLPMMAICGIKEELDVRKTVRTLSMQNPRCSYDMWDGAAQNIPFKCAARLNKTIEDFVDKVR